MASLCIVLAVGAGVWFSRPPAEDPWVWRRTFGIGDREATMLVVRLPRGLRELEFVSDPLSPKSVRAWREELGAEIVFNGAYFQEDGTPSGYWKTGKGASAVSWPDLEEQSDPYAYTFMVSAGVSDLSLSYLPFAPREEPPIGPTFLSFPTLVANGVAIVESDSGQRARRTALAEDADGNDYLVLTEEGTVSLYELAQWLSEQPERFVTAGNLDGGPSTGVSIRSGGTREDVLSAAVPNVVAVFAPESAE